MTVLSDPIIVNSAAATPGAFDHVVVNDDVDVAYNEMEGIVKKVHSPHNINYVESALTIFSSHRYFKHPKVEDEDCTLIITASRTHFPLIHIEHIVLCYTIVLPVLRLPAAGVCCWYNYCLSICAEMLTPVVHDAGLSSLAVRNE